MRSKKLLLACLLCASSVVFAENSPFKVESIKIMGLSHLPQSVVTNNLPIKIGETLTQDRSNKLITTLFKTGYFNDIKLRQKGDTLVVDLTERPTIGKITIKGNSLIKTKQLKPFLLKVGLRAGNIFDRSKLARMTQSLEQQYYLLGKYPVRVKTTIKKLKRNRVEIMVNISEGLYTKVARVNFVGNHFYSDGRLKDNFQLSTPNLFTIFNSDDQYTSRKMKSSLQELSDYYTDHGFLKFRIDSSQVSLTPTKKHALLTVNLTEGGQYQFGAVGLEGRFIVPKKELERLVQPVKGNVFSRKEVMSTAKAIQKRLANKGYAFATVNPQPVIDEKTKTVAITFYVNPGKRVYIHQIIFKGNNVTNDKTLRERMVFPEGGLYNLTSIEQSTLRLKRLPYIQSAVEQNVPVPGSTDQVNIVYTLKERSANKVGASLGYSELNKVVVGGYLNMPNIFGTGNIFDINLQLSKPYQSLNFTYTQPYFTQSGVSQSINVYLSKLDNQHTSLVSYSLDQYGTNLTYGVPMSVFDRITFGGGLDHTKLVNPYNSTSQTVSGFTNKHGNNYNTLSLNLGWSRDTTNDAFFPSVGGNASISGNVATPISSLTWYKLTAKGSWFHPIIWQRFVFGVNGEVDYGDGYGKIDNLPFFQNFYGGGWGSVRGYAQGSLGPDDQINCSTSSSNLGCTSKGDALGGNFKIDASMNLYFPVPFVSDNHNVRMGLFADAGNVYDTYHLSTTYNTQANPTHPNFDNLRYSVGVQFQWLTPIGAIGVSFAKPINKKPGDDTRVFQFTLGQFF